MEMQVAITGLGCVSPFGLGARALWEAQLSRRTVFAPTSVSADGLPECPPILAARLPSLSLTELLGRKGLRAVNLESQVFIAAAMLALRDAGVELGAVETSRIGTFVGTTRAGMDDYLSFHIERLVWGPARVTPTKGPNTGFNAPASHAAIRLGARGPNMTLSSRSAASLDAVMHAADFIRRGRAQFMLAGGIDLISYAVACSMHADGRTSLVDLPRPYDVNRSLPVPGEGAAVVLLESLESARERGARVLATVGAWSSIFEPAGAGALASAGARSLREAMAREGVAAVDAVFSSAVGDRQTDAAEAVGLAEALGGSLAETPICPIKGGTGECDGASGGFQVLTAALSIAERTLPPVSGTEVVDPALPRLLLPREPLARPIRRAAVHVLDPSGRSSTLILRAPTA